MNSGRKHYEHMHIALMHTVLLPAAPVMCNNACAVQTMHMDMHVHPEIGYNTKPLSHVEPGSELLCVCATSVRSRNVQCHMARDAEMLWRASHLQGSFSLALGLDSLVERCVHTSLGSHAAILQSLLPIRGIE